MMDADSQTLDYYGVYFSVTEENMGATKDIPLIENGENI